MFTRQLNSDFEIPSNYLLMLWYFKKTYKEKIKILEVETRKIKMLSIRNRVHTPMATVTAVKGHINVNHYTTRLEMTGPTQNCKKKEVTLLF